MSSSEAVFAPAPANARVLPVWASALIGVAFVMAVQVGAVPAVLIMAIGAATGDLPEWADAALLFGMILPIFIPLIAIVLVWTRAFERRPLASIGLGGGAFRRYARGYGLGLLLAGALIVVGALIAPEDAAQARAGAARLLAGGGGVFLLLLAFVFMIQSAAEEITFRGWMLSAVAARRGVAMGVILSSVTFALVHTQYVLIAPLPGLLVMLAIGVMGVVFAFGALAERSVWGACGAHGAYNMIITTASLAMALGEQPDRTAPQLALETFMDVTTLVEYDPSLPPTIAVLAVLAFVFWRIWKVSARRRAIAVVRTD